MIYNRLGGRGGREMKYMIFDRVELITRTQKPILDRWGVATLMMRSYTC